MQFFTENLLSQDRKLKIHLIGVAGSGMSGLAQLLLEIGHEVRGSDRVSSRETERLKSLGLIFSSPHQAAAAEGVDYVIYSSAIRESNPVLKAAKEKGIKCLRRAECLAAILHNKAGVIISGTHGKTTTSALSAHVLKRASHHPSYYVGAEIPVLGTNAKWDHQGELMVAEGDESDGTLVLYKPKHSIILNIEAEHLDFYRDLDHVKEVFSTLVSNTKENVIYCKEDANACAVVEPTGKGISYGWTNADYTAENVTEGRGVIDFTVFKNGTSLGRIELGIPGKHNVLNALSVIALADLQGCDFTFISSAMATFAGAKRRFETKFISPKHRIIDDYGHHPTEVEATLKTAQSYDPKRIIVLFQPHRYSRTQLLAQEFGKAFQLADHVLVTDIFAASEDPIEDICSETIVKAIKENGETKAESVGEVRTAHYRLGNLLKDGDLVITLGAGNVHEAGTKLANDLNVLSDLERFLPHDECDMTLYEPMRKHTTILIGGPAQYWFSPKTFQAFAALVSSLKERGIPVRIIGRGSNLLVRDGGIRGAVIHPSKGQFSEVSTAGNQVTVGAGVRFKKVASAAQAAGIGGFEWMEGIPGNVGGSLRMNAGAMGTETFDQVVEMTFLDESGKLITKSREEIIAHYRNVPELSTHFAVQAVFKGEPAPSEEISEKMLLSRHKRNTSQPKAASAGCIFKNPLKELGAGKLIDELGLKGSESGKAAISEVHGNFFVNQGGATAQEMLSLIDLAKEKALAERGITLETEVQILGEDHVTF